MADYQEVHDDRLKRRIQRRFGPEMAEMRTLGFTEAFYVGQISSALNPLWWPLLIPVAGYASLCLREVITLNYKLDLISHFPYFIHEDVYCYSDIDVWGVSYTTMFTDGLILETASYNVGLPKHPEQNLVRQRSIGGIAATWYFHRDSVEQRVNEERETLSIHTRNDALAIQKRKNEIDWGNPPVTWPGSHHKKSDG